MKKACISLDRVSVRFKAYQGTTSGIKETVVRWLNPPQWKKLAPPPNVFWGLKDISLQVNEGDRLGILGLNGAGKSTLLKVISRIYRPTEGDIRVTGRVASLIEIGAGFDMELTGRENAYLNGAIMGIKRSVINSRLAKIEDFAELSGFLDMPLKHYSTGMQLRLGFTIATEVEPDILILDELFAGGDARFVEKAQKRMESFIHQSKVMILVSHKIEDIKRFCNRCIVLEKGRLVYSGDVETATAKYDDYCKGTFHFQQHLSQRKPPELTM